MQHSKDNDGQTQNYVKSSEQGTLWGSQWEQVGESRKTS